MKSNYIFPQEYSESPPSHILNGAIHSYFGLYDYYRVTKEAKIKAICDKIVSTFANNLEKYDTGYWSLYDRTPYPYHLASPHYNTRHITQLKALYLITGNEIFIRYSEKFRNYHDSWNSRIRYIFFYHLRQIHNFRFSKIKKIPEFLKNTFLQ